MVDLALGEVQEEATSGWCGEAQGRCSGAGERREGAGGGDQGGRDACVADADAREVAGGCTRERVAARRRMRPGEGGGSPAGRRWVGDW